MIVGLHHVSLAYADLETGIRTYRELLGRELSARSEEDGAECAYFALENSALRLVSPTSDRMRERLQTKGDGTLFELAFKVADADQARQRLKKISVWPGKVRNFQARGLLQPDVVAAWRCSTWTTASRTK